MEAAQSLPCKTGATCCPTRPQDCCLFVRTSGQHLPLSLLDIFAYSPYPSVLSLFVCAVASSLAGRTGQLYRMSECVYTVVLRLTSLLAGGSRDQMYANITGRQSAALTGPGPQG